MTVGEWIGARVPRSPADLRERLVEMLGVDAGRSTDATTAVCIHVAQRELGALLASHRFDRGGALDLLTIDALVTLAFEHAAERDAVNVEQQAADAISRLGELIRAA